jgi:hypothetical protein
VAARGRLRAAFRKGIEVVHGVPLLVGGVQNVAAVWALSDINAWLENVNSNNSRDIQGTRKKFSNVLVGAGSALVPENSEGGPALPPPNTQSVLPSAVATYNLYLPANLENRDMMVMEMVHASGGNALPPVTYQECCNLIGSLISELNEVYLTDLGAAGNPIHAGPDKEQDETVDKFVFVGFSIQAGPGGRQAWHSLCRCQPERRQDYGGGNRGSK